MDGIQIRSATPDDFDEILNVCSVSLGWSNSTFDRELFRWKHETNSFGRSLIMVAESRGGLVAVRPFMRWRFAKQGETLSATRAVDTATRPEARGQGLFRTLTESGIEVLKDEGVDIIFNTPNEQSRPGYLKMGWREIGQIPVGVRLRSPFAIGNLRGARVPASKPSVSADFGLPVDAGLEVAKLASPSRGWSTDHDLASLRWRYAQGPIEYRWIPGPLGSGIIARLRRRGTATELLVATAIGESDKTARAAAVGSALDRSRADYSIAPAGFARTVTIPPLGPAMIMRPVITEPQPQDHYWEPGDLELF